jgi:hypothetical protein
VTSFTNVNDPNYSLGLTQTVYGFSSGQFPSGMNPATTYAYDSMSRSFRGLEFRVQAPVWCGDPNPVVDTWCGNGINFFDNEAAMAVITAAGVSAMLPHYNQALTTGITATKVIATGAPESHFDMDPNVVLQ